MKRSVYSSLLTLALLALPAPAVLAQADDARFSDPQRLFETFAGDALIRLDEVQKTVASAEARLETVVAKGTATPDEIAALKARLQRAVAYQAAIDAEVETIADLVVQLTEDQIFDLNRALEEALRMGPGLALALDAEILRRVIDGDYDIHGINVLTEELTRAAQSEARRLAASIAEDADDELATTRSPAVPAAPAP